ncbi:hypothetical protein ABW19_dt0202990 [Dactylella cylindrospora]|nr:hypothetical protein ABW19_dt0202990 [Dactylella cylindrospora]
MGPFSRCRASKSAGSKCGNCTFDKQNCINGQFVNLIVAPSKRSRSKKALSSAEADDEESEEESENEKEEEVEKEVEKEKKNKREELTVKIEEEEDEIALSSDEGFCSAREELSDSDDDDDYPSSKRVCGASREFPIIL